MKLLVFVYMAVQIIATKSKILPDDVLPKLCHRSDPNVKSCLWKQFDKSIHYIVSNGFAKYNVPKMDPLDISLLTFERTVDDFASFKGTIKNMRIIGLSNFALTDVKYRDDGHNIVGDVEFNHPHNYITFDANIAGKILNSAINIDVYVTANFTDVTTRLNMGVKTITKRGVKYFTLNKFTVKTKVGGSHLTMQAKEPQNQAIMNYVAKAYNTYPNQSIDVIHPFYAATAENLVSSEIEKVLASVPAETLLPE